MKRVAPGRAQESVWEYPRPRQLERVGDTLRVVFGGQTAALTRRGYRVLGTSHPPTYYFPPDDVRQDFLAPGRGASICEFKGVARYWTLQVDDHCCENAARSYPTPNGAYFAVKDFFSFYPSRVGACWVGDEHARAQPGGFYGGWITSGIPGPFKGATGTWDW